MECETGESIETREKILIAAGELFARKGFAATTVREISRSANVNLASMNYYFGDKKSLYINVVRFARESRADQIPFPDSVGDRESDLKNFIKTLVGRIAGMNDPPWQVQLIMREVLFPTDACQKLIDEYFRPVFQRLLGIMKCFSPEELTAADAYRLGFSVVGQVLYLRFTSQMNLMFLPDGILESEFQNQQIADHVFRFSLAALKSEGFWESLGPS